MGDEDGDHKPQHRPDRRRPQSDAEWSRYVTEDVQRQVLEDERKREETRRATIDTYFRGMGFDTATPQGWTDLRDTLRWAQERKRGRETLGKSLLALFFTVMAAFLVGGGAWLISLIRAGLTVKVPGQ